MVLDMHNKSEISPSLRAMINQFGTDDQRRPESYNSCDQSSSEVVNEGLGMDADADGDTFGDHGAWDFDHDDQASVVDEGTHDHDEFFSNQQGVPDMVDILFLKFFFI